MPVVKKLQNDLDILANWDSNISQYPNFLQALKETAAEALKQTGLPTPKWEDWKYTNIRFLDDLNFTTEAKIENITETKANINNIDAVRVQLLNSDIIINDKELPKGLRIFKNSKALEQGWVQEQLSNVGNFFNNPVEALNTARTNNIIAIYVQKNVHIQKTLFLQNHIENLSDECFLNNPRVLIYLDEGAKLDIIEEISGTGFYLNNKFCNITLKPKAKLGYYSYQKTIAKTAYNFNNFRINAFEKSCFEHINLTTDTNFSRNEVICDLLGEDIECRIKGAYCLKDNQHLTTIIKTSHFEKNSKSTQVFKGVINNEARAVFQGKIHVYRDAEGTEGHQLNRSLLLSDKAESYTKPELEIYTEDVKCSHGASSGKLDKEELFYLRSRGIDKNTAQELLVLGFLTEILSDISNPDIKELFMKLLTEVKIS